MGKIFEALFNVQNAFISKKWEKINWKSLSVIQFDSKSRKVSESCLSLNPHVIGRDSWVHFSLTNFEKLRKLSFIFFDKFGWWKMFPKAWISNPESVGVKKLISKKLVTGVEGKLFLIFCELRAQIGLVSSYHCVTYVQNMDLIFLIYPLKSRLLRLFEG